MSSPSHVFEIFIRATPERVWEALTDADLMSRYLDDLQVQSISEPSTGYRVLATDEAPDIEALIDEADPPHRLVLTLRVLFDADTEEEPPGRVEWLLAPANDDGTVTRVTLRHGALGASRRTWTHMRHRWVEFIDSMKTYLETGTPLGSIHSDVPSDDADADADLDALWHRSQAVAANSTTWQLLENPDIASTGADPLLDAAHAASYHWALAADRTPANAARAAWLLSRCYAVIGDGERALHHADRSATVVAAAMLEGFDLGYAHEARARALACLGRHTEAASELRLANAVVIDDPEDHAIFTGDLLAEPWFGLTPPR